MRTFDDKIVRSVVYVILIIILRLAIPVDLSPEEKDAQVIHGLEVWVYEYSQAVHGMQLIDSGDYLTYLGLDV